MTKRVTVLEGWFDQESGWEFEMPAYMVRPILGYVEAGSGPAGVEELAEEYLLSRFWKQDDSGKAMGTDEDFWRHVDEKEIRSVKAQFARAEKGKARKGVFYWRRVIEWDDEEINNSRVLEDVCYNRVKFSRMGGEVQTDG